MTVSRTSSLGRTAGFLVIIVFVLVFTGLFATWYSNESGAAALQQAERLATLTDNARRTQVDFKTQVQLWKNVLLRGQDPAQFETYHKRFESQQELVQKDLQSLEVAQGLPEDLRKEVAEIRTEHARLGALYADGLHQYVPGDASSIFRVDKAVQGIDQALNTRIDQIAVSLTEDQATQLSNLRTEGAKRYHMLQTISLALGAVAVVVALVLAWRASRPQAV